MIRVKICGVTTAEDARYALENGADALGLNFVPGTPRCLDTDVAAALSAALPPFGVRVGIFVDESPERVEVIFREVGLDAVQLHGNETPEACRWLMDRGVRVIRALRVKGSETIAEADRYPDCTILLDAFVKGEGMVVGKVVAIGRFADHGNLQRVFPAGHVSGVQALHAATMQRVDFLEAINVVRGLLAVQRNVHRVDAKLVSGIHGNEDRQLAVRGIQQLFLEQIELGCDVQHVGLDPLHLLIQVAHF